MTTTTKSNIENNPLVVKYDTCFLFFGSLALILLVNYLWHFNQQYITTSDILPGLVTLLIAYCMFVISVADMNKSQLIKWLLKSLIPILFIPGCILFSLILTLSFRSELMTPEHIMPIQSITVIITIVLGLKSATLENNYESKPYRNPSSG